MTMLNGKLWVGSLIFVAAALVFSAVAGGIEWALASLGAMVLIGMTGAGIYTLAKVLRHSDTSVKGGRPEGGGASTASFDGIDSKHVTDSKPAEVRPISEEDKRLIMEHVDELFVIGGRQSVAEPAEARPISEEDKRLIMEHVDELFAVGGRQSAAEPAEARPISEDDERLIMKYVNELFEIGGEQSLGKPS